MTNESDNSPTPVGAESPQLALLRKKIGWICQSVRFAALIWLLWSVAQVTWVWHDRPAMLTKAAKFYEVDLSSVTEAKYWTAFASVMVSVSASTLLVRSIWRLMQIYLDGRIFTTEAAERLRIVALMGFFATGVDILMRPIGIALVSTNLLSKMPLYAWLHPQDLLYGFICGFVLAVATILKTATEIAEDHGQII